MKNITIILSLLLLATYSVAQDEIVVGGVNEEASSPLGTPTVAENLAPGEKKQIEANALLCKKKLESNSTDIQFSSECQKETDIFLKCRCKATEDYSQNDNSFSKKVGNTVDLYNDGEISHDITAITFSYDKTSDFGREKIGNLPNSRDEIIGTCSEYWYQNPEQQTSSEEGATEKQLNKELIKHDPTLVIEEFERGNKTMYVTNEECAEVLGNRYLQAGKTSVKDVEKLCLDFAHTTIDSQIIKNNDVSKFDEALSSLNEPEKTIKSMIGACLGLRKLALANSGEEAKTYASIDAGQQGYGGIVCKKEKEYTLDYQACKTAVDFYNANFVADLVSPLVETTYGQLKTLSIEEDAVKAQTEGLAKGQSAALEAQREKYKLQANIELLKATKETTKAISMFGALSNFPTPKFVSESWCSDRQSVLIGDDEMTPDYTCAVLYAALKNNKLKGEIFYNSKVKSTLVQVGALALSKAVVSGIVASAFLKQAKLVKDVKDEFDNAEFNQPENQLEFDEVFCLNNPAAPSCRGGSGGRLASGGGVDFDFSGGAQGQGSADFSDGETNDAGSGDDNIASTRSTDKNEDDLADILGDGGGEKGDNEFDAPGAAKVSSSGGGGGGSGGGAGGGGGGGGGAPGGGADGGGRKGKSGGKYGAQKGPSYSSGGSFVTGSGGRAKKNKKENAFNNLLRSKRGIASEVEKQLLPKRSKLFETISKRYVKVTNAGKLDVVLEDKKPK